MTTLEVRRARAGDFPRIARITVDVFIGEGYSAPEAEASLTDLRMRDVVSDVLVAVDLERGEVVGAVSLLLDGGPLAQQARDDEAEIRLLAVDRGARGRGAGEALTRDCIRLALERGKRAIVLSSQPTMAAAQRLYERLGFARVPSADWESDNGRAMLAYRLELGGRIGDD